MATKRGESTRQNICHAALELINEQGYDAATVAAICERAGVSNGSFFHFFKSKDDVLVEFLREEGAELLEFYAELDKEDALVALQKVIDWQASYYKIKGEEFIAHLHAHLILTKQDVGYPFAPVVEQCIRAGQESGVFAGSVDAAYLASLFFNDILALTSFASWDSFGAPVDEFIRAKGAQFIERITIP